ncbi:GntR family transcriptional regulator [Actinomadura viridis]|uniref:DNA-binding GntR family transcriptional regulator n=1 Tax=Actinomadura viridis TaxID=58110 RepID=A0A931D993_9ACTN|nr:GntR family transcriptional regulator [Actinomadura viridis]MBG6085990.1 DNA-binding GntR family transcriptional regulator [Actinomadura viridis]
MRDSDTLSSDIFIGVERAPGESLGYFATRVLRDKIVEGTLRPGQRIFQEAIAEQLGLSRIPVRDALRQLESEGLVRLVPNSPARVAELDPAEFTEIYEMREHLEPLAVERSAPNLTDEQLDRIHRLSEQIENSWDDSERVLKLDRDFHLASMQAARMPRLLRLVEDFWNSSQHFRRAYRETVGESDIAVIRAEHFLLVDALDSRDGKQAAQIARNHIRRTRVRLGGRLEAMSEEQRTAGNARFDPGRR